MSDGSRLRQSWYSALSDAEAYFRQLLTSPPSDWKRLSHSGDASPSKQKGKARLSSVPELADVVVHRNSNTPGEDVYKMVLEVPTTEEEMSLEPWKAVLTTPELRQEWDPAVEDAHLLEMFDRNTRISKTNYTLGWPSNPRDSVTISRAFQDATTIVDITTSLPRSPDEPAYLRPSPPFVRSHVQLFAWCIQYVQPTDAKKVARLRMTCFWQHDLKALWGFGSSTAAMTQQLATMTLSLFKTVIKRGGRVPKLIGYGNGVSVEHVRYQIDREALTIDYAIIPDDEDHGHHELGLQGMDEVHALREYRRLTRSIECVLPSSVGWDIQVTIKGSSPEVEGIPWSGHATRSSPDQILFRLTHGALTDDDAVLKVKVVIEVSGGTRGLRVNGLATKIHDLEERDPTARIIPQKLLQDVASAVDLSIQTSSSMATVSSTASSNMGLPVLRQHTERTPAAEKSILSKVRRNYIYFSSLLQEPEAKWRRTTEARGVSITQLDSIDPTLVVYRAEATFVGVGLWDLYGAVVSPGARVYWDKQHEDGVLLEDVNELTELWHFKTKPAWPVNGRDSVVLKTVYKSPTTIHVFSFSAEDPHLFPHIPPAEPNVIRTQVDLQGWSIEALSPTTTLLTLLEQSDPKGWTNKTSIPTQMINTLAGIGEFAIKCGGPPVVTRLAGSKANELRYDHERGVFKVEYEPSASRRSSATSNAASSDDSSHPAIECEIRCDVDTWAASLDIVVDPPPQSITCLRRHRLSAEGGGLWLTLTHDSVFVDDERLLAIVRRAPGKEKGVVMVNGAKIQVDVEELPEHEIKNLIRQKRVKPPRIPLDQPPVIGLVKRRKAEWSGSESQGAKTDQATAEDGSKSSSPAATWGSSPKTSSPLARFFTYAVDQAAATTQQAVAAMTPANTVVVSSAQTLDPARPAMQYALDALAWTQEFNSKPQTQDGWTLVSDKGVVVHRRLMPEISPIIPVHKGFKVIEGVSAEELASVITEFDCRKNWDERYESVRILESYGGQSRTAFMTAKGGFPFRDRGFYIASTLARECLPASSTARRSPGEVAEQSPTTRNAIFFVSTSFSPEAMKGFSPAKYDPYTLPVGRVFIDAWILETLDPYTKENYTIPSSRCTRLVAVDYAGSIPATFNTNINATMARGVLALETYMKTIVKAPIPITRLPAPGLIITEKKTDENGTGTSAVHSSALGEVTGAKPVSWKLKKKDDFRVLLDTQFDGEKKVYRSSVLVRMPQQRAIRPSSSRRDPSSVTIVPSFSEVTPAASVQDKGGVTPRPSHYVLSSSPHGRQRQPSGESLPESIDSTQSDATVNAPRPDTRDTSQTTIAGPSLASSSQSLLHTPMPPMPGALSPGIPLARPPFPTSSSFTANHDNLPSSTPATISRAGKAVSPSSRHDPAPSAASPPRIRQRAASSGSNAFNLNARTLYHADGTVVRGRTTSAAFGNRGDVRSPAATSNLVVLEMVVDTKTYAAGAPAGWCGYAIDVRARKRDTVALKRDGKADGIALSGLGKDVQPVTNTVSSESATLSASSSSTTPTAQTVATGSTAASADLSDLTSALPFVFTVHTVPASQLHSSGLSAERGATRHLVRLILPTAQYYEPPVDDPLTEASHPAASDSESSRRPRPAWLDELEREDGEGGGGGIVVEAVVRALGKGEASAIKEKKQGSSRSRVWINGQVVPVVSEKESLSSLGREELLSDRISKTSVLTRTPNETEPLPIDLQVPVAVADDLLLDPAPSAAPDSASTTGLQGAQGAGSASGAQSGSADEKSRLGGDEAGGSGRGEDSPTTKTEGGAPLHELAPGMASGLFGFLQSYGQNTLTMFGSGALGAGVGLGTGTGAAGTGAGASSTATASTSGTAGDAKGAMATAGGDSKTGDPNASSTDAKAKDGEKGASAEDAAGNDSTSGSARAARGRGRGRGAGEPRMYTGHTLLFVALIAFLLGSLLRSLLSPAEFIYVVADADGDAAPPTVTPASLGIGETAPPALTTAVVCPAAGEPGMCTTVAAVPSASESAVVSASAGIGSAETTGATGARDAQGKKVGKKAAKLAQSAGVGVDGSGWREIRRLLEIKYLVGGWDFQVAVVRRH